MRKKTTTMAREFSFFEFYGKFINDSKSGKRFQANGKVLSQNTIENYAVTKKILCEFCDATNHNLRLRSIRKLNMKELTLERNYWKKFYRKFTDYLYNKKGFFDNYVGLHVKNLKVFFNYLNKDLLLGVGEFHKSFYVRKEEVPIVVLLPEELNFLIYDKQFEAGLSSRLRSIKDIFVFGCTVALRISDLMNLRPSNLRIVNDRWYLTVRSQKKGKFTQIRLPQYAIDIIKKYRGKHKTLLPPIHKVNLNLNLKDLMEKAGFCHPVSRLRHRRGILSPAKTDQNSKKQHRFCDLVSSHTMRRTAITTMLSLGMPEYLVRTISGHSPGSKEFFRYVSIAQSYQDSETLKVFEILKNKEMQKLGGAAYN